MAIFKTTTVIRASSPISCPIVEASGRAVAALTVPLVRQDKIPAHEAAAIASELRKAAKTVSEKIGASAGG